MSAQGKNVLFVGTKRQAQEAITEEATAARCTTSTSDGWRAAHQHDDGAEVDQTAQGTGADGREGSYGDVPRRKSCVWNASASSSTPISRYQGHARLPDVVFVIDSNKEAIAVKEPASRHPVVAIVDTNCDPDEVDWVIPQ